MRITNKLSIITSTVALSMISLSPVHASTPATEVETSQPTTEVVTAPLAVISYEKPAVSTTPAPSIVELAPQSVSVPVAPATPQSSTPAPPTAALQVDVTQATPAAPVAPTTPPASSGKGATIASAALAQLGVPQDCTALATNSLAAAGIHFHGWPADYLSLGSTVSAAQAQPGDLIYYPNGGMGMAHIAVYIGNGQAVHGGWNGGTTAIASAFIGSGATFIRV